MVTKESILETLSAIVDPDLGKDIVTLGFIANLEVEEGSDGAHVLLEIRITTPACPVRDEFKLQAEQLVGALEGVVTVTVTISSQSMGEQRHTTSAESGLKNVGALIAIASCKGGVGKSTVTAAMARELTQRGHRVGLLDTDIFGPSIPTLFNRHDQDLESGPGNTLLPADINGLKVMSFGFWLGDSPAVMRGPMVTNYVQQFLHGVSWGELDYLLLDLPPGTGDIQLTITQTVQLDGAVVVTTPQPLALADVGKGILMFEKVDVPVLGVVENMAYFEADGVRHAVFGSDGAASLQQRFGVELLGQLPLDPARYGTTFDGDIDLLEVRDTVDATVRALGSASVTRDPAIVDYDERQLRLSWPDGREVAIDNLLLRSNCGCAHCVNEFTGERTIDRSQIPADIKAEEVRTVGNYAVSIKWSDGHSTGLYPYRTIEQLAATATSDAAVASNAAEVSG